MAKTAETTEVRREITIDASPETIWSFLVDPEKAVQWMGSTAELDPRPGGLYRVAVAGTHIARGEFVELEPPRRLVHTWGWEPEEDKAMSSVPPGSSTIEIELEPVGDSTIVRFVHRDLPSAESAASHTHGWDHYLPRLVAVASGSDPGRDPWLTQPPR
ncbi:MAG: hypothetical protein QOJ13_1793 [Gaiellales bacterium]|nr:hypothetical protein [Gaiellales bacterium]